MVGFCKLCNVIIIIITMRVRDLKKIKKSNKPTENNHTAVLDSMTDVVENTENNDYNRN